MARTNYRHLALVLLAFLDYTDLRKYPEEKHSKQNAVSFINVITVSPEKSEKVVLHTAIKRSSMLLRPPLRA